MEDEGDDSLEMLHAEYFSAFHYHAERYRKMLQSMKHPTRFWVDGNQTKH